MANTDDLGVIVEYGSLWHMLTKFSIQQRWNENTMQKYKSGISKIVQMWYLDIKKINGCYINSKV
jgi:hypothetical protein